MKKLGQAIEKGVGFIRSAQLADGSFESLSSPNRFLLRPTAIYRTTFGPAIILAALSQCDQSNDIRQKLAAWLLNQKSDQWSFNYWAKNTPEHKNLPYPDDLDATFCALIALHQHNPASVDGGVLGSAVKLLLATEERVGGPYRTWLVDKSADEAWLDVDLAVNANVAGFLRLVSPPLPNLNAIMDEAILTGTLRSPYYPSTYPVAYFLARAYTGSHTDEMTAYLLKRQRESWWDGAHNTALAVSSLIRLDQAEVCAQAAEHLIHTQQPDGSWPAEAFCIDPVIQNKKHYSGSPVLTTALVVEALSLYQQTLKLKRHTKFKSTISVKQELSNRIIFSARQEIGRLADPLRHQCLSVVNRIDKEDQGHEISLLPRLFNESLFSPVNDEQLIERLGQANLYGWAAYTIYDNFLDNEGQPQQLSVANVTHRYSLKHFNQVLPQDDEYQTLVANTFDAIDGANIWEVMNCRAAITKTQIILKDLPKYQKTLALADRSLGHTLAPAGVLAASGFAPNNWRVQKVLLAFRHYLAARQLNDDMHDWQADLRAGILTYVVTAILQDLNLSAGRYQLNRLIPKMQRQFWHHTLADLLKITSRHIVLARSAAKSSQLLKQPNIVTELTNRLDKAVKKTAAEQIKTEQFLQAYSGKNSYHSAGTYSMVTKNPVNATPTAPGSHLKL